MNAKLGEYLPGSHLFCSHPVGPQSQYWMERGEELQVPDLSKGEDDESWLACERELGGADTCLSLQQTEKAARGVTTSFNPTSETGSREGRGHLSGASDSDCHSWGPVLVGLLWGRLMPDCPFVPAGERLASVAGAEDAAPGRGGTKEVVADAEPARHRGPTIRWPFKCSECGKSFRQSAHLAQHQHTVSNAPTPCPDCPRRFRQRAHLLRHRLAHTGERPFPCPVCGKAFALSATLLRHQLVHVGEHPYRCGECGRSYTQNSYLRQHQRSAHAGQRP
uniref:C2H2-type domain-containing protein n=1 Tax=Terrapene triunguis TaxID=2587831 RepID=A0A674IXS9_9SAUR